MTEALNGCLTLKRPKPVVGLGPPKPGTKIQEQEEEEAGAFHQLSNIFLLTTFQGSSYKAAEVSDPLNQHSSEQRNLHLRNLGLSPVKR